MNTHIKVLVTEGNSITKVVSLTDVKSGATKIKAPRGAKIVLADEATGFAPENITVMRVGNDLHVSMEGSDLNDPDLIIENYYGNDASLIGLGEDGAYHSYIASDGDSSHFIFALENGTGSAQVLGAEDLGITGFSAANAGAGLGVLGWAALGALGLAGLIAATDGKGSGHGGDHGGGGDGGNGNKLVIGEVTDNVGDKQGPIMAGDSTDDNTPTFSGSGGTPGKVVTIIDNGKPIGSTIVDHNGDWEWTPENPLPDGPHEVVVIEDGKDPSDGFEFEVDTKAPGQAIIRDAIDDVAPHTGVIANGGLTNDNTPTFNGTAEANSTVTIYVDGKAVGSTTADANGNWNYTPSPALPDGAHTVTVTATDKAGNVGLPSEPYVVVVDTQAPPKPVPGNGGISDVHDNVGDYQGPIANGDTTDDNTPTFSGTGGTPGDTVIIRDDGKEIGRAEVDANGDWVFTPEPPLKDGSHPITIIIQDPAGNESEPSDDYVVIVDTGAPPKPVPGAGGIDGAHDNVGDYQGNIENGGITDDDTPTFSGSGGNPGDTVIIKDGDEVIGSTKVDDNGDWEFTPEPPLTDGPHPITVIIKDPDGKESEPSDEYVVIVDTDAPPKPVPGNGGISDVHDNVGDYQGPIANGDTTDDNTPTFSGTGGTPGDTVIIRDNGEEIGRAEVDANGDWVFTPEPPLPDGSHPITIIIQDPAGNKSEPSDDYVVIVDTQVGPPKPVPGAGGIDGAHDNVGDYQGNIENGGITDDDTPTFSGSGGNPGDTVIIRDNGEEIGRAEVDDNGDWEFTPNPPLPDGPHPISVIIRDPDGKESEPSDDYVVNIDTQRPDRPTLDSVHDNVGDQQGDLTPGDTTDDARPEIRGTAEANSLVSIYNGDRLLDTVRADASGNWVYTPPSDLGNGRYNLHVTATDAAGNVSDPSNEFDFNLITGGTPPAPAITSVIDNQGEYQGPIDKNGVTDDARPEIRGTAQAGTTVSIYDGTTLLGTAPVRGDGTWTFTPETDLPDGLRTITATATDDAGNVSPTTGEYPIVVDTVAPGAPTDQQLDDNVGDRVGLINDGDVTDDATPTFSGLAEVNATVDIFQDGVKVASVETDADGRWSYTPAPPLADGPHSLAAQIVDAAGNRGPMGPTINFEVDTSDVAIAITHVADNFGDLQGDLASGSVTDDTTPTIHGTASANALITITIDGDVVGSVRADASGAWSYTPATPLGEGPHTITATAENAAGEVSDPTAEFHLEIDTTAPTQPTIDDVIDDVGDPQGSIDNGGFTDDTTPTLRGTGEPNSRIDIYDGSGRIIGTATVNAQGLWETTISNPLSDGTYNFTVIATDAAGNPSAPSAPYTVTVDTQAPDAPIITSAYDDVGNSQGDLASGATTDDTQPTLHGTAEANSLVTIYADGNELGSARADSDGSWSFTPTTPLSSTTHAFTAKATDAAGNPSSDSNTFTLNIATAPQGFENFNRPNYIFELNEPLALDTGLTMTLERRGTSHEPYSISTPGTPDWLFVPINSIMNFSFSGMLTDRVSFEHGRVHTFGHTVEFYDASGTVIGTRSLTLSDESFSSLNFTAPGGAQIAGFRLIAGDEGDVTDSGFIIDNLSWLPSASRSLSATDTETTMLLHDADEMAVAVGGGAYEGSDADEVFSVADTAYFNAPDAAIRGGDGIDTLKLTGANQVLDFGKLAGKLSSVEVIDITGTGDNTLKLSLGDVLEQGGKDLFANEGKTQMMVKGDAGDVVELSDMFNGTDVGDWSDAGARVIAGVTYHTYQHSGLAAELLVQDGVTTHLLNG